MLFDDFASIQSLCSHNAICYAYRYKWFAVEQDDEEELKDDSQLESVPKRTSGMTKRSRDNAISKYETTSVEETNNA